MHPNRRHILRTATLATTPWLAMQGTRAFAQAYPAKPVKLVVPYPAGGATDLVARAIAERLGAQWGQQVVVDNKPGAGTTVAAEQIARAPGDGYTLYMTTSAHTISASLYKKLSFDPLKDFAPITLVTKVPLVLVASPSLPAKTLAEVIKLAKSRPQGLSFASPGNGTAQHLAGEMFKLATLAPMTHIPYRGDAPALTDLMGSQVDVMFATLSAVQPLILNGKLMAIALAHSRRIESIGKVPTVTEAAVAAVPGMSGMPGLTGFEAATWFGLLAPASMPADLRKRISEDVIRIVAQPEMRKRLMDDGGDVINSTPQQFADFMQAESARWAEAVKVSGAKVD
jgi:tripartite-type tricarboxylate transporter receptor subunit TctC